VLFKGIKKWSPPFRAATIHIQNEKAELTSNLSLGSSAIFALMKPIAFHPFLKEGSGFLGFLHTSPLKEGSNIHTK